MLEINNLSCERDEQRLFSGINYTLHPGELIQITGDNGMGKTTLLTTLCGFYQDYQGEIRWQSQSIKTVKYDYVNQLVFIGHKSGIKDSLTPLENLQWFFAMQGDSKVELTKDRALFFEALTVFNLVTKANVPCYSLSAGQQRRVALTLLWLSLARKRHTVWVLDEPFNSLDTAGINTVQTLINSFVEQGGSVILSTHREVDLLNATTINLNDYAHS